MQIRARGDVAIRPAQPLGEIGQARKLPMRHDPVRDPQPAHVGILRRRDIEQAVIAPAKIIRRARRRVVERLLLQPRIGIERMLLAFELLRIGELLAGCDEPVLRLEMRGIRSGRLCTRLAAIAAAEATSNPADLQAAGKAFEIALLIVGKIYCQGLDFHGGRRSSCGHDWRHQQSWGATAWKPAQRCCRETPVDGPASLVAAEIHLGRRPAGACDGWLHCNIQVACHAESHKIRCYFNALIKFRPSSEALFIANREADCLKNRLLGSGA